MPELNTENRRVLGEFIEFLLFCESDNKHFEWSCKGVDGIIKNFNETIKRI